MACELEGVPKYLHWDGRQVFCEADFLNEHYLYRLGNPIEFPQGTITALSCKWSLLIHEIDVLTVDIPAIGDSFKYAVVEAIRSYSLKERKNSDETIAWHKLSCALSHAPKECDYSHSEILIKHDIFEDYEETRKINSFIYTYGIWQTNKTVLQRKSFKEMRKEYRKDIIKLFCLPEEKEP